MRYTVKQVATIMGEMFQIMDTLEGQLLAKTFYFYDEAEKSARRLNSQYQTSETTK